MHTTDPPPKFPPSAWDAYLLLNSTLIMAGLFSGCRGLAAHSPACIQAKFQSVHCGRKTVLSPALPLYSCVGRLCIESTFLGSAVPDL